MAKRSGASRAKPASVRGKKTKPGQAKSRPAAKGARGGTRNVDSTRFSKKEQERRKRFNKLVSQFWVNPEVRARFRSNPIAVFREFGLKVPAGLNIAVVEDTKDTLHIVIPYPPVKIKEDEWPPDDCRGLTIGKTIY